MAFNSRFGGKCSLCGVRFPEGTRINLVNGDPEHETCPDTERESKDAVAARRLKEAARLGRRYADPDDIPRPPEWVRNVVEYKVSTGELNLAEGDAVLEAYFASHGEPVENDAAIIEVVFRPADD